MNEQKALSHLPRFYKTADLVANLLRFLQRFLIGKHITLMIAA